jgi:acetolactate synthase-1/2/3 large subunit
MAEGYARVSGKPGVVFVTSVSGLKNMAIPMQDASCDGTPMVVICSQSPTITPGPDGQTSFNKRMVSTF